MSDWKVLARSIPGYPPLCVEVEIVWYIKDKKTGEVRSFVASMIHDEDEEPLVENWISGHLSKDPIRSVHFHRANGSLGFPDDYSNENHWRYQVNLANSLTGEVFYREFPDA